MTSELAKMESGSVALYHQRATDAAGAVKALVLQQAISLGKKKYLPVAAYQAVANAMGCIASARDVRRVEGGWEAVGEVRRLSDGMVLSTGTGFVGLDEEKWSKGPEYASRAMCQTRAIGRACRAAFAFVVPLLDAGLETTPLEEMQGLDLPTASTPPPAPLGIDKLKRAVVSAPKPPPSPARKLVIPAEPPPHTDADAPPESVEDAHFVASGPAPSVAGERTHDGSMSFRFGRDKGIAVADLDEGSLRFYEGACKRDLADESKARFHASTTVQLATVQAELKFRGLI